MSNFGTDNSLTIDRDLFKFKTQFSNNIKNVPIEGICLKLISTTITELIVIFKADDLIKYDRWCSVLHQFEFFKKFLL
jgi:hypothetical protein